LQLAGLPGPQARAIGHAAAGTTGPALAAAQPGGGSAACRARPGSQAPALAMK
jgi:hypothetical protein